MSDVYPTRSVGVEMKDERRAMHEGYVFLDEKCLLLAGEILAELGRYARLRRALLSLHEAALDALRAVSRVPFPPGVPPRRLRVRLPVVFEIR